MHALHRSVAERINSWVGSHHGTTIVIAVIGLMLATGMASAVLMYQSPKADAPISHVTTTPTPSTTPAPVYYSPLSGVKVPDQASTQQVVTGVMIENSPDARPQSGLKNADVVFEAIAEGGITRFMALYQPSKPQLIGPVRSLRLYDIDWLAPFQAAIAHVGGSQQALSTIRDGLHRDLDQFFNGGSYWRVSDRYAPHNVYTSFAKLDALNQRKGYSTSDLAPWPRQDGAPAKTVTAKTIDVTISGPLYNSHYVYDPTTNTYARYQAGAPHLDREGGQITPTVVIVMDVNEQTVLQDGYREQITTTGSGNAHIFENGTVTTATWTKADAGSQIKFTDAAGKEVALNRGQTWITAVPANRRGRVVWQTK